MKTMTNAAPQRLKPKHQRLLEQWLVKYPQPGVLLAKKYLRLYCVAKKSFTNEEIDAICKEACVYSAPRFNPKLGFLFETYVVHNMRAHVQREVRHWNRDRTHGVVVTQGVFDSDGGEFALANSPCKESHDDGFSAFLKDQVLQILHKTVCDPRMRSVFIMRYGIEDGEPRTLKEVGDEYGVTPERVRQIVFAVTHRAKPLLESLYRKNVLCEANSR